MSKRRLAPVLMMWFAGGAEAEAQGHYVAASEGLASQEALSARVRPSAAREGQLPASGGIVSNRLMLKGFYEFRDGTWRVKPFVGAGFGLVEASERLLGVRAHDGVTAYELRGGVSLGFTQKLLGSLEYRWVMGSKPGFLLAGIPTKLEIDRHGFVVGINYKY